MSASATQGGHKNDTKTFWHLRCVGCSRKMQSFSVRALWRQKRHGCWSDCITADWPAIERSLAGSDWSVKVDDWEWSTTH